MEQRSGHTHGPAVEQTKIAS